MKEKRTGGPRNPRLSRLRSWTRYSIGLRVKLIVLVVAITCLVIGSLYAFSYISMRSLVGSIYEQRARSIAALITKSIEEKDYVLYYSAALDADVAHLLEDYESVVGITVIGRTARGFLTIASTDPSAVGALAGAADADRYSGLRSLEVAPIALAGVTRLRAVEPLFSGPDLIGVVIVDMSVAEQAQAVFLLSWRFAAASIVGIALLAAFMYFALRAIVTRPVRRLAEAMSAVSRRKCDVEVRHASPRLPGLASRDEIAQLVDGFNLMTRVLHSHEQELMKLVVLDELTGTYTADHLRVELERELSKTRRYKHPTSFLVVDVRGIEGRTEDDRKSALIGAAGFLVRNLRNVDTVFRVGPARFAALLPETSPEGAAAAARRIEARTPDVATSLGFPVSLSLRTMGWIGEDAPATSAVLADIAPPAGA